MKKSYLLIVFISFFLLNCEKKEEVANVPYIISKEEREFKKRLEEGNIPPPPTGFYGSSNVIIDKEGELYFYQRTYYGVLGCIVEENPLPEFINLQPKDLVKIPSTAVGDFLKENTVKNPREKWEHLIVACQLDTLKSEGFFNIMHFLRDNQVPIYLIRRTTQEEDVVLKFKESNVFYDSDSIQWDKSRIRFFE
ncbi:hypothetical protein ACI6PS_13445 [Flavobacterium sp. PLA-1-15]|uniref:hypothetical protein n=1 Tax=Flavobacterium sp. PLA-1-15 TaxID=3380533 RepID=UPI003B7B8C24